MFDGKHVKFEYTGKLRLTRGEYGEDVRVLHLMRESFDPNEHKYVHDPNGDVFVWDDTYGFLPFGPVRPEEVGRPLD